MRDVARADSEDAEPASALRLTEPDAILTRFDAVAHAHSDRIALDDGDQQKSFSEVRSAVYAMARELMAHTQQGDPVVAVLHNTVAFPIVQLAALITGRLLIPIDAAQPLERQSAIFEQSAARILITVARETADLSFVPPDVPRIICEPDFRGSARAPIVALDLDAPSVIGFTSGSTGRPKGVAFSLRGAHAVVENHVNALTIGPADIILGIASLSAGGMREALSALLTGAKLRLIDLKAVGLMAAMRVLREERVTLLSFIPSALRHIMAVPGVESAFAHLRVLELGGEGTTTADIALFRSKLPSDCAISLGMGSTEASLVFRWIVRDEALSGLVAPIGYMEVGRVVRLIDEGGGDVANEAVGELLVCDSQVALGYWRNARLEEGPFRPVPDQPSARAYATGDLVFRRDDGLYEYVGRRDRMVKIRGLRADLGEIEAALRESPGVADAAAIAVARDADGAAIVAFVVAAEGREPPSDAMLRADVVRRTAEHMAPSKFHWLSELPRLANHKPNLVRLQALHTERSAHG